MKGKIGLGIVVFRPKKSLFLRIQKALDCGLVIYIYDNSPDFKDTYEYCRHISAKDLVYLSDGRNLGLAKGISSICKHAYSDELSAIINFDQDTIFNESTLYFINKFFEYHYQLLSNQSYSAVAFTSDELSGLDGGEKCADNYGFIDTMLVRNSGSLFILGQLEKIGWHDSGYFVDGVDYEFCLRSLNRGFRIGACNHAPGIDHKSEQEAEEYRIGSRSFRKYPIRRIVDSISANSKLLFTSMISRNFRFMAKVFRLFLGYLFAQIFVRIISAWHILSMLNSNSDNNWEQFGLEDPYFSVLTDAKYHSANLSEDLKKEFFNSGQKHIVNVFEIIRKHINPLFSPQRTMEFGCGIGRLIVPLSQFSTHVVGVDVSIAMLREAQSVCSSRGITNVSFARSDDELSALLNQKFDFIHSIAVLQHIDVHRGERIMRNMLLHLSPGGVGAIGVAYYVPNTIFRRIYRFVTHKIPMGRLLTNLLKGRNIGTPVMQMNPYNLNRLLLLMQEYGVSDIHLSFTEPSGNKRGLLLCFEMPRA